MRERIIKSPIDFPSEKMPFLCFPAKCETARDTMSAHWAVLSWKSRRDSRADPISEQSLLLPGLAWARCATWQVPCLHVPVWHSTCLFLLPRLGVHYWNFFSWTFDALLCFRGFTLCCVILKLWWVTKRLWGTEVFIRKQV